MVISPAELSLPSRPLSFSHDAIEASWQRCLAEYKLDPTARNGEVCVASNTLSVLQSEMAEFLADSATIIGDVRKAARDVGRIVIITNADGIIVRSHADSTISREILREGFSIGSNLCEQVVGTNGIGTCIVSRQPITVHAGDHFTDAFRGFTCSAAPVYGPDGNILAAVDVSGRTDTRSAAIGFAQHFIGDAAQRVSLLLFRKQHRNDCIVAISHTEDELSLESRTLIATDHAGRILGATSEGYRYLGVTDLKALAGRSLGDVFDTALDDLKPLSKRSVRFETANRSIAFATAFMPATRVAIPVATSRSHRNAALRKDPALKPLDRISGSDAAMQGIVNICRKIINKSIPMLLLGETGAGKDTLARAIHDESDRAHKPYVAVNCAAIPATLLASELFGYAPGTFTGGTKNGKIGKIAASHGGTLFLDEIGDMPLELQGHLLRVLEDRAVTPLGSIQSEPVNLRIICATNRELPDLVSGGRFRKDLYYRIRGAQFEIPALRQRTDFATLVPTIVKEEAQLNGGPTLEVSADALRLLKGYSWPGNFRELRNLIRLILSLHGGESSIEAKHLPDYLQGHSEQQPVPATAWQLGSTATQPASIQNDNEFADGLNEKSLRELNSATERLHIIKVLEAHRWQITVSAAKLGISRAALHRKIRHHAISARKHLVVS